RHRSSISACRAAASRPDGPLPPSSRPAPRLEPDCPELSGPEPAELSGPEAAGPEPERPEPGWPGCPTAPPGRAVPDERAAARLCRTAASAWDQSPSASVPP